MTGIYFRVKRNGKWVNKEIEYLTADEREEALKDWDKDSLIRTIHILSNNLDLLTEEDEGDEY